MGLGDEQDSTRHLAAAERQQHMYLSCSASQKWREAHTLSSCSELHETLSWILAIIAISYKFVLALKTVRDESN